MVRAQESLQKYLIIRSFEHHHSGIVLPWSLLIVVLMLKSFSESPPERARPGRTKEGFSCHHIWKNVFIQGFDGGTPDRIWKMKIKFIRYLQLRGKKPGDRGGALRSDCERTPGPYFLLSGPTGIHERS